MLIHANLNAGCRKSHLSADDGIAFWPLRIPSHPAALAMLVTNDRGCAGRGELSVRRATNGRAGCK